MIRHAVNRADACAQMSLPSLDFHLFRCGSCTAPNIIGLHLPCTRTRVSYGEYVGAGRAPIQTKRPPLHRFPLQITSIRPYSSLPELRKKTLIFQCVNVEDAPPLTSISRRKKPFSVVDITSLRGVWKPFSHRMESIHSTESETSIYAVAYNFRIRTTISLPSRKISETTKRKRQQPNYGGSSISTASTEPPNLFALFRIVSIALYFNVFT